MDAEEHFVDDVLAVDRPVHRLADGEVVRGRPLDVDEEAERDPAADRLDESEPSVGAETRVVGLGQLIDEEVLAGLERRDPCARFGDSTELQ